MAYCRFSNGDVYLYHHVSGHMECCSCKLAPLVKSIYTVGLEEDDPRNKIFGEVTPCEKCNAEGCKECMVPGNAKFNTRSEALAHLQEHRDAGHEVPEHAFDALRQEIEEQGDELTVYCKGDKDEHNE